MKAQRGIQMRKRFRQTPLIFLLAAAPSFFFCQSAQKPELTLARPDLEANKDNLSNAVSPDREFLKRETEKLVALVIDKKPAEIIKMLHPEKEIFVDIKGRMNLSEIKTNWSDPESALYALYWDTALYRKISGDPDIECFRDVLKRARHIELDVTLNEESATVRLNFKNRPSPMVMGDLAFEKVDKKWYLVKLF